jgi:hypothetical protein
MKERMNEQRLHQVAGMLNVMEIFLDRGDLTKKEIEFLQQALAGASCLLSEVVNSSPPAHMTT